jgi:hypothetical protein
MQEPVEWQIFVALARLGHDGNGSAILFMTNTFSISGKLSLVMINIAIPLKSALHRRGHCLERDPQGHLRFGVSAIPSVKWPNDDEKNQIKTRNGRRTSFGHCIGFLDGSHLRLAFKPALESYRDYYNRKSRYTINCLVVCDDQNGITFFSLGWGGSVHDKRVYTNTPASIRARMMINSSLLIAYSFYGSGSYTVSHTAVSRRSNISSQTQATSACKQITSFHLSCSSRILSFRSNADSVSTQRSLRNESS